jgi:hypothetical protein
VIRGQRQSLPKMARGSRYHKKRSELLDSQGIPPPRSTHKCENEEANCPSPQSIATRRTASADTERKRKKGTPQKSHSPRHAEANLGRPSSSVEVKKEALGWPGGATTCSPLLLTKGSLHSKPPLHHLPTKTLKKSSGPKKNRAE